MSVPRRALCVSVWMCLAAFAGTFDATPQRIPQGGTLRARSSSEVVSARMNGRTAPMFQQKDGRWLGLMPVPALEKPGEYKIEFLDKSGAVAGALTVTVANAHFARQNIVISKTLSELKATPDEVDTVAAFRKEVLPERYWTDPLAAPVRTCMTSPYGVQRLHNGKPTGDFHAGLDLRAREGFPIRAAAAGVVKIARPFNLHGGTVAIDHGQGLQTMYLHMSKITATEGALVQPGDIVGYAGSTGRSTASHLHWSIYVERSAGESVAVGKMQPCAAPSAKNTGRKRVR